MERRDGGGRSGTGLVELSSIVLTVAQHGTPSFCTGPRAGEELSIPIAGLLPLARRRG